MTELTAAEEGVGAVGLPTPPVAVGYQSSEVPVAVSGDVGAPRQMISGELTVGAGGAAVMVTGTGVRGLSPQPPVWVT